MSPTETIYVLDQDSWRDGYDDVELAVVAPNERVQQAITRLNTSFDNAYCQAVNHSDETRPSVGWGLHSREGNHGEEITYADFSYTALVDTGVRVFWICEDCHATLLPSVESPAPV